MPGHTLGKQVIQTQGINAKKLLVFFPKEGMKWKNWYTLPLQSPLSCPTSPVKVVHCSNALADETKAILEDSTSFRVTAQTKENLSHTSIRKEYMHWPIIYQMQIP